MHIIVSIFIGFAQEVIVQLPVADTRAALAGDAEFALAARYWTAVIVLEIGPDAYTLEVGNGAVSDFRLGKADSPNVTLTGPEEDWTEILAPAPRAYFQDVLSGVRFGAHRVEVDGDFLADVFPYYAAIQRLLEIVRSTLHPCGRAAAAPAPRQVRFEAAAGRYVHLDVLGTDYRVYFEESGSGTTPLLLQHTAGSDARQFRHLLEDPDLRQRYRMIAWDLPYHGKSNPPETQQWWAQSYQLTHDFLIEFVGTLAAALRAERAIFVGCSIGGLLAPDLALARPDLFRAVVAINGAVRLGSKQPDATMQRSWDDPRIASDWHAAWMMGRTSPVAPEAFRRETAWYYAQAGPGVLRGDLHYYQAEHDLTGRLDEIDTSQCGVYVVAGEYDSSRVAADGASALAAGIPGAQYTVAEGAGHFMMSEYPERFRAVLLPILDDIDQNGPA
jgi:pimeloyl-ACP methyl ester carboxylesterase